MNIAIDYDDTYTEDPELWDSFIAAAKNRGHKVYCVTRRNPLKAADIRRAMELMDVEIIFVADGMTKRTATVVQIDVWIDDNPKTIDSAYRPMLVRQRPLARRRAR